MLLAVFSSSMQAAKDPLNVSISTSSDNNQQEASTQTRIDGVDDETRVMLDEYQQLGRELDVLTVYNKQLQRLIDSQEKERASIREQMLGLEATKREIVPLMLHMVEWLDRFTQVDHPFLPEERRMRVDQIHELMDRADVSVGEKYRRILEAYQIEMDYGRTIEAYRGELKSNNTSRTVDFLRVGRIGLYYQTLDRQEAGHWDYAAGSWKKLPDNYNMSIRKGLRVARKQAAPDLLNLPVPAPVAAASQKVAP
ncbi:MAG: DUF3450 domain-containing protein [Gammaproteobacteria bacterium]|nr:DUF3450 domain-containing protein [Gammaproteobacteria bacterium]